MRVSDKTRQIPILRADLNTLYYIRIAIVNFKIKTVKLRLYTLKKTPLRELFKSLHMFTHYNMTIISFSSYSFLEQKNY